MGSSRVCGSKPPEKSPLTIALGIRAETENRYLKRFGGLLWDITFTERPAPAAYAKCYQVSVDMRETGFPNLFMEALQMRFTSSGFQHTDEQFWGLWRHYRLKLLDTAAVKDKVPDVDFWFDAVGKQGLLVVREMIRGLAQQCLDEDGRKSGDSYTKMGDFIFMVASACTWRGFVVTKTGYVGMVPKETEKGDAIAPLGSADAVRAPTV